MTTRALELHRYDLQLPSYRGRTLRIALVSDLHVDPALGLDYYREALARVSAEQPDLVLLAGDFVTRTENAALLPELLRDLRPRVGSYAVLGNHDHWADAASVRDALLRSGVQLLSPSGIRVALGEGAGESVLLSGCEDPWGGEAWSAPAQRLEGEALLVVSHSADAIYRLARAGADAVFAGHYHAGQIRLPGLGALVLPSIYGRRYDHGCFSVDGCELFVSAGVGAMGLPLRIYCPPDVFLIELRGGDAG